MLQERISHKCKTHQYGMHSTLFVNQVNAHHGKAITVPQANELISIAQRIINDIPGK